MTPYIRLKNCWVVRRVHKVRRIHCALPSLDSLVIKQTQVHKSRVAQLAGCKLTLFMRQTVSLKNKDYLNRSQLPPDGHLNKQLPSTYRCNTVHAVVVERWQVCAWENYYRASICNHLRAGATVGDSLEMWANGGGGGDSVIHWLTKYSWST